MRDISIRAPAKINLFLNVLYQREDGFHEIETIYQRISLWDTLYIKEEKDGVWVESCEPGLPLDEKNLAFKAASLLKDYAGVKKGVRIHIKKKIPIGSGLGGGSSDAASVLIGLNKLWKLDLGREELMEIGVRIGADVPFFITGWPCAFGSGIGDVLMPLPPQKLYFVLIVPEFTISTKWAYENLKIGLTRKRCDAKLMIELWKKGNLKEFSASLYNALESGCMERFPELLGFKKRLLQEGVIGVGMSGSGPTIFGVVLSEKEAYYIKSKLLDIERTLVTHSLL